MNAMTARSLPSATEPRTGMTTWAWLGAVLLFFGCSPTATVTAQDDDVKVLMGVFAHPDDEGLIGPILARYEREGVETILVTATDGRLGAAEHSGYGPGDELAAARREELQCAADMLGIDHLEHLEYYDQFNSGEGYDGFIPQLRGLLRDVKRLIEEYQPDVVITFGPDGFSNHMDHRLVGSTVTQVFISQEWENPPQIYYVSTPASSLDEDDRVLRGALEKYLTVQVPYSDEDSETAMDAMACHKTQFAPDVLANRRNFFENREKLVYLRPFVTPSGMSDDPFNPPSGD